MSSFHLFWHPGGDRDELLPLHARYSFAGRFRLIEQIGRGGFGQVWRVRDVLLDQEVALKISATDLVSETVILRKMSRCRYVSVFDYVSDSHVGAHAYSMELLEGSWMTLDAYRDKYLRGRLSERATIVDAILEILFITTDVLLSLKELHGKKYGKIDRLVHADVKPQNVYINRRAITKLLKLCDVIGTSEPFTKIGDLGLTCAAGSKILAGTPLYQAPEQAEPGLGVSAATDIFAVGQTIAYLLTGHPFQIDVLRHVNRIQEMVSAIVPSAYLANELVILLRRMTNRDPYSRGTADDAVAVIANLRSQKELLQVIATYLNEEAEVALTLNEAAERAFYFLKQEKRWGYRTEDRIIESKRIVRESYKFGVLRLDGRRYYLE